MGKVAAMSDETRCRSCQAPIRFERTAASKLTPVNPDGTPHWATCPQRREWRKSTPTQASFLEDNEP